MEAKIAMLTHRCCELFRNMNGFNIMGKDKGVPVGNINIQDLIHKVHGGALILVEDLLL